MLKYLHFLIIKFCHSKNSKYICICKTKQVKQLKMEKESMRRATADVL